MAAWIFLSLLAAMFVVAIIVGYRTQGEMVGSMKVRLRALANGRGYPTRITIRRFGYDDNPRIRVHAPVGIKTTFVEYSKDEAVRFAEILDAAAAKLRPVE